jgi:hypothetical protein
MDTFGRVTGWSLSLRVPTAWASAIVALVARLRLTLKVSVDSTVTSLMVVTAKLWVVVPAGKVSVTPVRAVKSPGATALPLAVAASTLTVCVLAADRLTVKVAIAPSATVTSLTRRLGMPATGPQLAGRLATSRSTTPPPVCSARTRQGTGEGFLIFLLHLALSSTLSVPRIAPEAAFLIVTVLPLVPSPSTRSCPPSLLLHSARVMDRVAAWGMETRPQNKAMKAMLNRSERFCGYMMDSP